VIFLTLIFSTLILEVIHLNAHKHKRAHTHMHTRTRTRARTPQPLLLNAHTHASLFLRVGQNHTFLGKYGVHTVFLTGKSPYIHSHIRCSYTVLTNPTFCVLTWKDVKPDGPVPLSCHARNAIIIIVCTMCPPCQDCVYVQINSKYYTVGPIECNCMQVPRRHCYTEPCYSDSRYSESCTD